MPTLILLLRVGFCDEVFYLKYHEYLKFQELFKEQKRLEYYQQNRKLPMPKTRKLDVIILVFLMVLCLTIFFIALNKTHFERWAKISIGCAFAFLSAEFYLRHLCVKIVECYQHYATEDKRRRCLCVPSCSEYAITCLKKYGLIKALFKIRKRLFVTCRGDDYKIDPP